CASCSCVLFSLFRCSIAPLLLCFFFTDTSPTAIYTLSLHDALPILHLGLTYMSSLHNTDQSQRSPRYCRSRTLRHRNESRPRTGHAQPDSANHEHMSCNRSCRERPRTPFDCKLKTEDF